jgi:tRNA-guanine family transglycosylase
MVMAREILGFHLLTFHNLYQIARLMRQITSAIETGGLTALLKEMRAGAQTE